MDIFALAQQLFRHMTADKNTLYVLCPFNIGDFLINGGLCHALLKKKRKRACVLIERDRFANCGLNFVGVKKVRYIPLMVMDLVRQYIMATCEFETDNFIYGHFHSLGNIKDWVAVHAWNPKLSFVNRWEENVPGLPLDTEVIPPLINPLADFQKQRLHETYVLDKERTIIIMPYNTNGTFEDAFWIKLVSEIKQKKKGCVLYTNVANSREKVIPGTSPLVTTFQELTYIADKVNCFIGMRSGIFDLLAFTNAKLLYMNWDIENWWFFDLNLNFNHTNSRAFYLLSALEQKNLRAFMQQNNITSLDNVISRGRVSGKDMVFDKNSLIEKVVSAVD